MAQFYETLKRLENTRVSVGMKETQQKVGVRKKYQEKK